MNVSKLDSRAISQFEPVKITAEELKKSTKGTAGTTSASAPSPAWQKDILLSGLNKLENNIQVDNSHPLDKISNQPIENFDEALIELSFTKSDKFFGEARAAQANMQNSDVLPLFLEENSLSNVEFFA